MLRYSQGVDCDLSAANGADFFQHLELMSQSKVGLVGGGRGNSSLLLVGLSISVLPGFLVVGPPAVLLGKRGLLVTDFLVSRHEVVPLVL